MGNLGKLDTSDIIFPLVKNWFRPTNALSGYNHSCSSWPNTSTPLNGIGFQEPHSGSAYVSLGLVSNDLSLYKTQYVTSKLPSPLKKDSIYKVSFWVSLAEFLIGNIRNSNLEATSSIGIYFSSEKLFYATTTNIPLIPQLQNNPTRFLDDTSGWMEVTGLYRATGGEQYMTIGNFNTKENTPVKIVRYGYIDTTIGYGSYYLDDVSLTAYGYLQNIATDTILCEGLPFTKSIRSGFDSCVWNDGDTTRNRILNTSGTYWVTSYTGNVSVTDTVRIQFKPQPIITTLKDTTVCFDEVAQILLDAGQFKSYIWKPTGETTRTIYSTNAQVYLLSVTDTNNCSTSKQVAVMETCPDFMFIPNAFTPNGDGINDVFLPRTLNLVSYNMSIVNRWGEILFTTTNPQQGWDGKNAQADVYVVIIYYKVDGKEQQSVKQNVSLLR
jgi:gliding motility-associated-like protein